MAKTASAKIITETTVKPPPRFVVKFELGKRKIFAAIRAFPMLLDIPTPPESLVLRRT